MLCFMISVLLEAHSRVAACAGQASQSYEARRSQASQSADWAQQQAASWRNYQRPSPYQRQACFHTSLPASTAMAL